MTIAEIAEKKTGQGVKQFIINLVSDRCCMRLLQFFGAHPNSRFNKLAVVYAIIDEIGSRLRVERALIQLINEGVVKINTDNDTRLYLLTSDEPVRQFVLDVAKLDWRQWQQKPAHS